MSIRKSWEATPLENRKTYKEFNNTITKAKLLYETVLVNPRFQCALAWNGSKEQREDTMLIYTSHKGKVMTRSLNFTIDPKVWDSETRLTNGSMLVAEMEGADDDRWYLGFNKKGLLDYTGKMICKPKFTSIKSFGHRYLMGTMFHSRRKVGLEDEEFKIGEIFDYRGKTIDKQTGIWRYFEIPDEDVGLAVCRTYRLIMTPDCDEGSTIGNFTVYMSQEDKLYKSQELPIEIGEIVRFSWGKLIVENIKSTIKSDMQPAQEYTIEEILAHSELIDE